MAHVPLNALRVFEAAARRGSFSAAAEELCVTQSAVSHQIRQFEDWLGGPLFAREGNRIRLLPHGEALAKTLAGSFSEIELACRRARRAAGPPTLVIAAIPSVAVCWLVPRLADFRARHPATEIRVVYAIHGQRIDFVDTDFALVFSEGPPRIEGIRATPFLPGASAPVCNAQLAAAIRRAGLGPGLVAAELLHDSHLGGWREWLARAGIEAPSSLPGPVFEDFNLLRAAALAGQGVALCPVAMIEKDLGSGRLVQLSSVTVHEEYAYYLLERPPADAAARKAAEAFRSWLLTECGAGSGDGRGAGGLEPGGS
jgi:LysR family transcriptional regulator, glycine cleavage system transcriptional activator